MHTFWFSFLTPVMLFFVWAFPKTRRSSIWLTGLGIAGLAGVAFFGVDLFLHRSELLSATDAGIRVLYSMLTTVEVPFLQFSLASLLNLAVSKYCATKSDPSDAQDLVPEIEAAQLSTGI